MTPFNSLSNKGIDKIKNQDVIFCSIVRDCAHNLKHNISDIEKIGSYFKKYTVIIFENNSHDNTKIILQDWAKNNSCVFVYTADYKEDRFKEIPIPQGYNSANCKRRITKMAKYRNQYLEYIASHNLKSDYIIVVDLDVAQINVKGVLSSFGIEQEWDVIASNSYSRSPHLKKRYHDTYALIEDGTENIPQSEQTIDKNRYLWANINYNMPFIRVFSAFGGLAIYKYELIKDLRYFVIDNHYGGVEVKCEHVSLHTELQKKGHNRTYINPNMKIKYQNTLSTIFNKIKVFILK